MGPKLGQRNGFSLISITEMDTNRKNQSNLNPLK